MKEAKGIVEVVIRNVMRENKKEELNLNDLKLSRDIADKLSRAGLLKYEIHNRGLPDSRS